VLLPDIPPVPGNWSSLRLIGTVLKLHQVSMQGIETKVEGILERLDILPVAGWAISRLSRGQAYKAVLAAFMAADPEVWFVDEPFSSGMDPRGLNCFKEYAREAAVRGHTIIYTTQIVEVAEQFSNRVCIMSKGQIKAFEESKTFSDEAKLSTLLSQLREQAST
jgi:ABC-2 type transport system ATP-binding protein